MKMLEERNNIIINCVVIAIDIFILENVTFSIKIIYFFSFIIKLLLLFIHYFIINSILIERRFGIRNIKNNQYSCLIKDNNISICLERKKKAPSVLK